MSAESGKRLSLGAAMGIGARGFAVACAAGFALWALSGSLPPGLGESGLYALIAVVILTLGALLLHPLGGGRRPWVRFPMAFAPAFVAYAGVWCAAWFAAGFGLGEWVGAIAGSLAFSWVAGLLLRSRSRLVPGLILAAGNAAGYFLGGKVTFWMLSPGGADALAALGDERRAVLAKITWGVVYGLGFGAGVGAVFHAGQPREDAERAP